MARDTATLREFEARLRNAGALFVRVTGRGMRRWRLGPHVAVDLPVKGYEHGHLRKNVEAEIKRALKAAAPPVTHRPRDKRAAWKEVRERREQKETPSVEVPAPPSESPTPEEPREEAPRPPERVGERPDGASDAIAEQLDGDGQLVTTHRLQCSVSGCTRTFGTALALGRHRQATHGIAGKSAKARRHREQTGLGQAELAAKTTKVVEDQTPKLVGPPPLGMTRPTPVLVAGTASVERVEALAREFIEAVRQMVTEYRLVRDENGRLVASLQALEAAVAAVRRR